MTAMSAIGAQIPFLRRYAYALTGSQKTADSYVAACLETLLIDPSSLRQRYLENVKIFQTALREGCSRNRIDLIPVRTSESYSSVVANYLVQRGRA